MFGKTFDKKVVTPKSATPSTLDNIAQSLKSWRSSSKEPWEIPEDFWVKIIALYPAYTKKDITERLSISSKRLNKKINEKELLASSTSVANSDDDQADECFVEATIQDSVVLSQQLISITRTDGVVLQLPKPEYAETINLILTFCKG